MIIGYARTSTIHQTAGSKAQLEAALEFMRKGDVLVVTQTLPACQIPRRSHENHQGL